MYSPLVIDKQLAAAKAQGHKFKVRSLDESLTISHDLAKAIKLRSNFGIILKPDGVREFHGLTDKENEFIQSEILVCRYNFRYCADRYLYTQQDAGEGTGEGVGLAKWWPSQEHALKLIAQRQEECYRELRDTGKNGGKPFTPGIRLVWHKTRQQGATAALRLLQGHRMITRKNTRSIAASLDDEKKNELYTRDKVWYDNLPFFLKFDLKYDVKATQIEMEHLQSRISYQQANQQAGVGTSQQFDFIHMTEVGLWTNGWRLEFDLIPTIPNALSTFVGWESTANGRGPDNFWYVFTENIRKKVEGYHFWTYVFTPCYLNQNKNRAPAPDSWRPNTHTEEYARLVEATSHDIVGSKVEPTRNHLYWYELEYARNDEQGTLAIFLSNYPSTPEQSFQYNAMSALPTRVIEGMRMNAMLGMPYEAEYKLQKKLRL